MSPATQATFLLMISRQDRRGIGAREHRQRPNPTLRSSVHTPRYRPVCQDRYPRPSPALIAQGTSNGFLSHRLSSLHLIVDLELERPVSTPLDTVGRTHRVGAALIERNSTPPLTREEPSPITSPMLTSFAFGKRSPALLH